MGRCAVCFCVSGKIAFQQTKPDNALVKLRWIFQRCIVNRAVEHVVALLDTILNERNAMHASKSCSRKPRLISDCSLSIYAFQAVVLQVLIRIRYGVSLYSRRVACPVHYFSLYPDNITNTFKSLYSLPVSAYSRFSYFVIVSSQISCCEY